MASKKVQCQICGRQFTRITQSHLNLCSPGLGLEEYRRTFGATSAKGVSGELVRQKSGEIAAMVVNAIAEDPELLEEITTRVGQHLFSEGMRGKVLGTAVMLLTEKSSSYQKLNERMQTVNEELFQSHRLTAGGPDGAPTDTLTLLQMGRYAGSQVKDAEDTLLRLLKSTIDDRKTHGVQVNLLQGFSGKHENIPIPSTFNAQQREALRRMGSRLIRDPKTVQAVVDKAKDENAEIEDAEYSTLDK